jgi:hypothetical protein
MSRPPARRGEVLTLGVTGHRAIPDAAYPPVRAALTGRFAEAVRRFGAVRALTALAAGADQLFAELALEHHAHLTVVCPGADYEQTLTPGELADFRRLKRRAHATVLLDHPVVDEEAYFAAGAWIVERCDLLLAVWDGQPARGRGGTADIVVHAHAVGTPVEVIWPPGVRRP